MKGRKIVPSRRRDGKIFNKTLSRNRRPAAHRGGFYR